MSKKIEWEKTEPVWVATPNIVAVWAFGSAQEGQIRPGGDVDIGVLFERKPTLMELSGLLGQLQAALQFEDIDLVVLNEANLYLRFEAVSGRPLFCRDLDRRAEFVSLTAREYEDELAFFKRGLAMRG